MASVSTYTVVRSLSVSVFIEKEPHKQAKNETKEERRKIGERDIVPSTQDRGHADVAWGKCAPQATQAGVTLSWRPPPF